MHLSTTEEVVPIVGNIITSEDKSPRDLITGSAPAIGAINTVISQIPTLPQYYPVGGV